MVSDSYQICNEGVWDTTMPGIRFDEKGVSNYRYLHSELTKAFPRGENAKVQWLKIINKIKKEKRSKNYDCIVGVSGGTDSSYLMHLCKENGLKPLAVNLDNGWNSEIAVSNINKITTALDIDLETYIIDYEEVKKILRAYLKSCIPWVDKPTDNAIIAILYRIASREKVKYILVGNDFRSEGKQPSEWTYGDARQLKYILRTFEREKRIKSFPLMTISNYFYYGFIKKIKIIYPYNYLDYKKISAQELLASKYSWKYYGGHHHENIFTRFIISYWLPQKFNIDKRKITLSAQIFNNEIPRSEALKILENPAYSKDQIDQDKKYVLKKLDLTDREFKRIWDSPNRCVFDFPSYYSFLFKYPRTSKFLYSFVNSTRPKIFYEMEMRRSNK